jgi:transcriptional regulator with XRE-family HTH domain
MTDSANARGLPLLRFWRSIRRMSQLDLSGRVGVSQRHISFIESGRARPSRWVLELLADGLDIPAHERNALFEQAGYALTPASVPGEAHEHTLANIDDVLECLGPYPCLVLDRSWRIARSNLIARRLFATLVPERELDGVTVGELLLAAPVRCLVANWDGLVAGLLGRMQQALDPSSANALGALLSDPRLPAACRHPTPGAAASGSRVVELRLGVRSLSFIAATTTFGTAADAIFGELWLEVYLPRDGHSELALRAFASAHDDAARKPR